MMQSYISPVEKPKSLYRQLTIALVLLVTLASFAVNWLNYLHFSNEDEEIYAARVTEYSEHLRESLEWPLWNIDDELIVKVGDAFAANDEVAMLTVYDDQQRIVYQKEKLNGKQLSRIISVKHEGQIIGSIEIGLKLSAHEERERNLLLSSMVVTLLLIVILLVSLRWILAQLLKKPVDTLVGAIGNVVDGNYPLLDLSQTYQEFSPILASFKVMADAVASRETSLRASEQKLLSILESVDACIYLKDTEGRYLFANRSARELWQVEMKDLIGFGDEKFFDAATVANTRLNDNRVVVGGETLRAEEVNTVCATGKTFFYQSTKLPLRREDGSIYALCGISVDITGRKLIEESLRVNEERLKLATRAGGIGIWDWDVTANILTWGESMYTLYGICKEEFSGAYDAWVHTLHPDDRQFADGEIQAALRGIREYAPEFRIVRPDGTVRNIKASAKVYRDAQGNPTRMVGTNFDLTEQKRIENELRKFKDHLEEEVQLRTTDLRLARNAAETANRAKSVFLSSMSHELRTPLNAVLGFSSLMRHDPQLTQAQRENLDIINRSGEHLLTLINDVLEMAKIEAGQVRLGRAPLDMGILVRDVGDMMSMRAKEKGLKLLIEQSSEFPRYIKGDEARLRQVLINLLGNAVKFTRQGGIAVRFGLKPKVASPRLLIEVEDTGVGISEADQSQVFEPFVQFGEIAAQKGTGLGLSITRQFVQLMGGTISFESTLNKGSIFRVELPVEKVASDDVVKPDVTLNGEVVGLAPGQPEYRILIVEDQLENQLLLTRLMKSVGFPVQVAENGEQALALFQSWQPQLIWMDWRMPVMDGLEATRRIRALSGGSDVKIVAVTASVFMEQREAMRLAGVDEVVRKPYRFSEIYESMTQQLGVQFLYADVNVAEPSDDVVLTSAMLSVLPFELRGELRDALESLETERIEAVIHEVASYDKKLYKILMHLAENFDYPFILTALQIN
jgi:PAS domain S-box-containing protein